MMDKLCLLWSIISVLQGILLGTGEILPKMECDDISTKPFGHSASPLNASLSISYLFSFLTLTFLMFRPANITLSI